MHPFNFSFTSQIILVEENIKSSCKNNILVIGVLPPPVRGMPMVTQAVLNAMKRYADPRVVRLSRKSKTARFFGLYKAFKVLVGSCTIIHYAPKSRKRLYMPADAGLGMYYTLLLVACAKISGFKIYLHHHSWRYLTSKDRRMEIITRLMGKRGIHVVLCEDMLKEFSNTYRKSKYFIKVSNAVLFPWPVERIKIRRNHLVIGHLSNLAVDKGLKIVIETFRKILSENIQAKLILAGPAMTSHEKNEINKARKEFRESIEYLGPVYGKDKNRFFEKIDVFLFPSLDEAQPLVMLESLCEGVPFVSYARGCISADLNSAGGISVPQGEDFSQYVLPVLKEWAVNSEKLQEASSMALCQARKLINMAKGELNSLLSQILL